MLTPTKVMHIPIVLELLSLISFAISGARYGISKKYDIFGVFAISFITSTGGGIIRDIIIGNLPIIWIGNANYVLAIIFSNIFTILFIKKLKHLDYILFIFDSLGLGIFTLLGINYGMIYKLNPFLCVVLGVINGSFGSVLRDVFSNRNPLLFYKDVYASLSILGGILFFILKFFKLPVNIINFIVINIIFITRILIVKYNLIKLFPVDKLKISFKLKIPFIENLKTYFFKKK